MSVAPTLVFPEAVESYQAHRTEIRAKLRDTYNRLHSISEDADWVDNDVRRAFPDFPIIRNHGSGDQRSWEVDADELGVLANQRAGAWYVKPSEQPSDTPRAYFKSTDGHIGVHDFSLRRSNLSLLPLVQKCQGIILVDSTRRGKRFPDALSKTVPIWCAVLNKVRVMLLPPTSNNSDVDSQGWIDDGKLWTLPSAIGRSEHSQIDAKVEMFAERLKNSAYDFTSLLALRKPLRPIFVSPASVLAVSLASSYSRFMPIVLASASKLATEQDGLERAGGYTYVQGSGDDHEAWSKGLTAPLFWENAFQILAASRDDIDSVIFRIVADAPGQSLAALSLTSAKEIRSTSIFSEFSTESKPAAQPSTFHLVIIAAPGVLATSPEPLPPASQSDIVTIHARTGKSGYRGFFTSIEEPLVRSAEALGRGDYLRISVATSESQSDANDLGVALLLILLVQNFDHNEVAFERDAERPRVTKDTVRTRLQWFLEVYPDINPSRNILNRVNEYLMSLKKGQV
ncbi:tRNA A64-2'-O-ribosylphosphate transferase, partial [Phenoliferia sp. Uapishka_3]